jgi:D-alanyl-D-alanine carboxypeptidase/D-alanyl-D-alanine-endopeptidase (penicillin-binding protein 4)
MRSHRRLAVLAAALAALACASTAQAGLATRLDSALGSSRIPWRLQGAIALDLTSGVTVYEHNADTPRRPASNEKLAVALTALEKLNPQGRIPTRVLGEGRLDGTVWRGRILIKGYGDPSLQRDDLTLLARRLRARGIRWVTGGIIGDETYFDRVRVGPGWKRGFYKVESPPLSALVVGRARILGKTLDNPALSAAHLFRSALLAAGIHVMRSASVGRAGPDAVRLADAYSTKIALLVRQMNRESDNFYAEMLLKRIGAEQLGRGSTSAGAQVVRTVLKARGIPLAGVRIADGSGLSLLDRMTPRALSAILTSAWQDARLATVFYGSLPIAGVNGTLEDRMESGPAYGQVRAKTGTTSNASALSGFAKTRFVFSILQNGSPVPATRARKSQDRFAQILAGTP